MSYSGEHKLRVQSTSLKRVRKKFYNLRTCYRSFGSGAVITCFHDLGLSRPRIEPRSPECDTNFLPLRHRDLLQNYSRSAYFIIFCIQSKFLAYVSQQCKFLSNSTLRHCRYMAGILPTWRKTQNNQYTRKNVLNLLLCSLRIFCFTNTMDRILCVPVREKFNTQCSNKMYRRYFISFYNDPPKINMLGGMISKVFIKTFWATSVQIYET